MNTHKKSEIKLFEIEKKNNNEYQLAGLEKYYLNTKSHWAIIK